MYAGGKLIECNTFPVSLLFSAKDLYFVDILTKIISVLVWPVSRFRHQHNYPTYDNVLI